MLLQNMDQSVSPCDDFYQVSTLTVLSYNGKPNSVCMRWLWRARGHPWWSVIVVSVLGYRWAYQKEHGDDNDNDDDVDYVGNDLEAGEVSLCLGM